MEELQLKRIKGYKIINKSYTRKKYLMPVPRDELKIKKALKDILKIFLILNLVNIMQFFIVNDEYVMNVFYIRYMKEVGFTGYLEAITTAFNYIYWYSLAVLAIIYLIFYSITNRKKTSLILLTAIIYIYSLINYIVTDIRGSAVTLCDVLSIKTALNVFSGMSFTVSKNLIIGTILIIVIIIMIITLPRKDKKIGIKKRLLIGFLSIMAIILIAHSNYVTGMSIWNMNYTYTDNGVIMTLVKLATNLNVKKPEGYNKEEVEKILEEYQTDNNYDIEDIDVNIVVVMNESFTDYAQNSNVEITEDNIPYFHQLQNEENVITGIMHSDAFGGYTANIEYEFLTQNTVAFLPVGSTVYQQYITTNIRSIVSRMQELNYTTYGIHLWNGSGYRRFAVYKFLGFDYYKFKEDYDDLEYLTNDYTTDKSSYEKIMEILNNKSSDEKIFSFNVTVQNHKPYDRFGEEAINYSENEMMNIYLQTEHKSDMALEELIEYLKDYDEKVILLFFGDHQPNVEIDEINDDEENKYKVPYLIWANYDIEEKEVGDTSANYLQSILMETLGLPKDEYTNYIAELREQIPVLTVNYYIGNNGEKYQLDDITSPYYEKIQEYRKIVYYQIFNK